ncbi:MAG: hypothetical protein GQ574_03160 [Crocinitomix sp.]|nr:hypothetical protein [Crocinitomix sp.]
MPAEKDHFEELRNLILESDRENYAHQNEQILDKLDELEKELNDPEKFAAVIQQSKAEIIDVLGPVMGKMIKKFISSEMSRLKQSIENKSKALFSFKFFKQRLKNKMAGVSKGDAAINEAVDSSLLQIFVIEQETGLLIGEYSHINVLEPDMVAGMLSAIKSFVESAFGEENSELESLEYSSYKILLYNFNRFYFACVMEGYVDAETRANLQDDFLDLTDKTLGSIPLKDIDDKLKKTVEEALIATFSDKYLGNPELNIGELDENGK